MPIAVVYGKGSAAPGEIIRSLGAGDDLVAVLADSQTARSVRVLFESCTRAVLDLTEDDLPARLQALDVTGIVTYSERMLRATADLAVRAAQLTAWGRGRESTHTAHAARVDPAHLRIRHDQRTVLSYVRMANPGREVGVLLDASAQHPNRTGREVLTLAAAVLQVPRVRVEQLLEAVAPGPDAARKRVGNYSLGRRQRLGLAQAPIGQPSVLVLDENHTLEDLYLSLTGSSAAGPVPATAASETPR